ncbi:chemotaxis-specific protein-glutamate methyltransferase CheB [Sphingomonas aestuarii]|jgi:two-component system, chemotaxis family, protein-glutamate methylesterase/glutaminase
MSALARSLNEPVVAAERPRVLIVDDSSVARAVIERIIGDTGRFEVAAALPDAATALDWLSRERVDVILLDIEMPGVDGLTALPDLIAAARGARILVVSSSAQDGASTSVQALALGAADTLVKPVAGSLAGQFTHALADRLARLTGDGDAVEVRGERSPVTNAQPFGKIDLLAIGASTGGIHALGQLLRALPGSFDAPILITQHLPGTFMPYFAAQVAVLAGRPCDVAADSMRVRAGRVIIAPGDAHIRVVRTSDGTAIRLDRARAASGCMPSVDPMFESVAQIFGERACGVVLSGMGRDGLDGARILSNAGGAVVAQDKATSVVWGMPGAVAQAGIARAILPPDVIGRLLATGRSL